MGKDKAAGINIRANNKPKLPVLGVLRAVGPLSKIEATVGEKGRIDSKISANRAKRAEFHRSLS
jgi:hypothetical protein